MGVIDWFEGCKEGEGMVIVSGAGRRGVFTCPQITSGPCADAYNPFRPLPPPREAFCARLEEEPAAALLICLMKAWASMGGGTMMLVQDINRHKSLVCNFASGGRKSSPRAPAAASFSSAAEVKHVTSPPVY